MGNPVYNLSLRPRKTRISIYKIKILEGLAVWQGQTAGDGFEQITVSLPDCKCYL